jgi:hypothetical protein
MLPVNYLNSCYIDSILVSLFYQPNNKINEIFFNNAFTKIQCESCYNFKRVNELDSNPQLNFRWRTKKEHCGIVGDGVTKIKTVLRDIVHLLQNKEAVTKISLATINSLALDTEAVLREKYTDGGNDRTTPGKRAFKITMRNFPVISTGKNKITNLIFYFRSLFYGVCSLENISFGQQDASEYMESLFNVLGVVGEYQEITNHSNGSRSVQTISDSSIYIQKTILQHFFPFEQDTVSVEYLLKNEKGFLLLRPINQDLHNTYQIIDYSKLSFFFLTINRIFQNFENNKTIEEYCDVEINALEKLIVDETTFYLSSIVVGRPGHWVCYTMKNNVWYHFNDLQTNYIEKIGSFEDLQNFSNAYTPFRHGCVFMYTKEKQFAVDKDEDEYTDVSVINILKKNGVKNVSLSEVQLILIFLIIMFLVILIIIIIYYSLG